MGRIEEDLRTSHDPDWTERLQNMVGDVNLHPDYGADGDTLYGIRRRFELPLAASRA